MARNDKDFLGLDVVSLADGMVVGTVDALLVDDNATVAGLVMDLGIYEAKVLSYSDILNVGEDAIMISSADSVKLVSEHPALEEVAELEIFVTDALAMTDRGELVGVVGDYFVDPVSGTIKGIEVLPDEGGHEAETTLIVPASQVLRIGPELVLIRADYEQNAVTDATSL